MSASVNDDRIGAAETVTEDDGAPKRSGAGTTFGLIVLAIVIAVFPMFFNLGDPGEEEPFGGADGAATEVIEEGNPDYEPWFDPIIGELPGEVESGIFALQAGLGAGVVGYALGFYRGRGKGRDEVRG